MAGEGGLAGEDNVAGEDAVAGEDEVTGEDGRARDYSGREFVAEFYDHLYAIRGREDIEFWVESARRYGGPVLELGCGTGRVLLPVARSGVEIVGLDLSESMLAICRRRLAEEPPEVQSRVQLHQMDMRGFRLEGKFNLITTPFRPFQHLVEVEDQLACLEAAHRHLAPGGRLIIDVFDPSLEFLIDKTRHEESDPGEPFTLPDGRTVAVSERVARRDLAHQMQFCEMIYYVTHPDGRRERFVHEFSMRHFFFYEMQHLLARAGFEVEDVYADFDRTRYGSRPEWKEMVFTARVSR